MQRAGAGTLPRGALDGVPTSYLGQRDSHSVGFRGSQVGEKQSFELGHFGAGGQGAGPLVRPFSCPLTTLGPLCVEKAKRGGHLR